MPATTPCSSPLTCWNGSPSAILSANAKDVEHAEGGGADATVLDRLRLTPKRIGSMAEGLRAIFALPDPVGEVTEGWTRPNGLRVERVRVPLGLVGIIYENRPNVTSDAAGLCLKSGNAVLLRGSGSAHASNAAICPRGSGRGWPRPACPRTA